MLRGRGLLTPIQRSFIAGSAALPDQAQFYLAGGTALAEYYFGHRLSFDLDFFTAEASLILPHSYQVESAGEIGAGLSPAGGLCHLSDASYWLQFGTVPEFTSSNTTALPSEVPYGEVGIHLSDLH
jgi:hypothetical protein